MEIRADLRQRYFTDARFYHTVNAMAKVMDDKMLTPNEMSEALEVAKAKYYLDQAAHSEKEKKVE